MCLCAGSCIGHHLDANHHLGLFYVYCTLPPTECIIVSGSSSVETLLNEPVTHAKWEIIKAVVACSNPRQLEWLASHLTVIRFKMLFQGASVALGSSCVYFCTHDVIMMQKSSLDCVIFKMVDCQAVVGERSKGPVTLGVRPVADHLRPKKAPTTKDHPRPWALQKCCSHTHCGR